MDSSSGVGVPRSWRRVAIGYIGLSALGLGAGLIIAWLPLLGIQIGPLLQSLPLLTAFLGMVAGALSLFLFRGAAAAAASNAAGADSSAAAFSGLRAVVQELSGVLTEERDKAVAFQEVFSAAMREVRVVSTRVARLTEAALDAELRLGAGVAEADGALRQPASGTSPATPSAAKETLPEIAELIRRGLAEQSHAISVSLEATAGQILGDADGPLQSFRAAVEDATGQMKTLGDTAALLSRDVSALDTASRETAVANAKAVARIGGAIAQIDAAVAYLPDAAASVTAAVERAALTLSEASGELRADGAAMEASRNDTLQAASSIQQATEALTASVQGLDEAGSKARSQLIEAIADVGLAIAGMPAAVASVTTAAEEAAHSLKAASVELQADGAVMQATRADTGDAAAAVKLAAEALSTQIHELDTTGAKLTSRLGDTIAEVNAAVSGMPNAAATVTNAAEAATQNLKLASAELQADGAAMQASRADTGDAAAAVKLAAEALTTHINELDAAGAKLTSQLGDTIAEINTAVSKLPAAAATVTTAAEHVAHRLADASAVLCADAAALAKTGRDTQQATAEGLAATELALSEAGHQTIATVAKATEMALAQLAAVIVDSDGDRESLTSFAKRTAALENVAASLVENAYRLDEAGQRSAAAGEWVAAQLDTNTARSEALLQAMPDVAAGITAAAAGLRHDTSVLASMAQQVSAAGNAAASTLSDVALLAENSAASLDAAGRTIGTASEVMETQIDRLAGVARDAGTQVSLLPDVAEHIKAAAGQLQVMADTWRSEQDQSVLPAVAARMEAAASTLDRLDAMSTRLENAVAELPADRAQQAALSTLADLSEDISLSVRRVEAALSGHEEAWPSVAASVAEVQAAALAVAQAASEQANQAPVRASFIPVGYDAESAPAAVIATLRHFDEVACQSEMLLEQAEALAEAVLTGRAPGLPSLLAERAPALLAEIDTTTRRLRSVATALALASDGVPVAERRLA